MRNIFKNKNVLITGHTGFKGTWLSMWLRSIGANVIGVALQPVTNPSHFELLSLDELTDSNILDLRDHEKLNELVIKKKPEFVFHLAAQPLVGEAYDKPRDTFEINAIGTLNLLESLKKLNNECVVIIITSDKCYENVEWVWGYRETDRLGGSDPYSASKAAAEIIIKSYIVSYFPKDGNIKIGIGRAGNVIGGGDWSEKRIIPDAMRSWSHKRPLILKNPSSTRPWQHVLEPLGGYLRLAYILKMENKLHGEAFNFGPASSENFTVREVISEMSKDWDNVEWEVNKSKKEFSESGLLKLNCDKALHHLNWKPILEFSKTIKLTSDWYKEFYNGFDILKTTERQISEYNEIFMKKYNYETS